jgi:putative tryptophan/tyrosine transport system substrate-binding protein
MRRRDFIRLLGGAAAAWPIAALAQQTALPVIGFLNSGSAALFADRVRAFRQGLSEAGYVEGRNATIEFRWADGDIEALPALAADLIRRKVNVIVTGGGNAPATAAKAATATLPIVFQIGGDPVEAGLVASLSRPGGNVTGVTVMALDLTQKMLELLHDVVPAAAVVAALVNPANVANVELEAKELESAARALGLELHVLRASNEREFGEVFQKLAELHAGALVIASDAYFSSQAGQLATLTIRHGVPAIYQFREFAAAGGLISYGGSLTEAYRQVGLYVGRILKGEKPAALPVMQPTKFELAINLRTAKALGLSLPPMWLARADEVIE